MIGIDEVGRGCLAGPLLVVAARQTSELPVGLTDSKLLNRAQRAGICDLLITSCQFGEGWVSCSEINARGLTGAMRLGVRRALRDLGTGSDERIIIDGPINYLPKQYNNFECLINADALVAIVSAASVYAKVMRDQFMIELAERYPRYGFDSHVGYATKKHLKALQKFGSLKNVHRQNFGTVRRVKESTA